MNFNFSEVFDWFLSYFLQVICHDLICLFAFILIFVYLSFENDGLLVSVAPYSSVVTFKSFSLCFLGRIFGYYVRLFLLIFGCYCIMRPSSYPFHQNIYGKKVSAISKSPNIHYNWQQKNLVSFVFTYVYNKRGKKGEIEI